MCHTERHEFEAHTDIEQKPAIVIYTYLTILHCPRTERRTYGADYEAADEADGVAIADLDVLNHVEDRHLVHLLQRYTYARKKGIVIVVS